jgi:hypothetical protein
MRLFIFEIKAKKKGPFALQTGFYCVFVQCLTTLIPIVGIVLRSIPAAVAGIAILLSFILAVYPIIG